jgi:hypothetical protein
MVDIEALTRVLPVTGLEPQPVAFIHGLVEPPSRGWLESIPLFEPPYAGPRVPFIEPAVALDVLFCRQKITESVAEERLLEAIARMKNDVAKECWAQFFQYPGPELFDCLPVSNFVAWLREEQVRLLRLAQGMENSVDLTSIGIPVEPELIDFLERAAEVTAEKPMFHGIANPDVPWSLKNLPAFSPEKALIELFPDTLWNNYDGKPKNNPFLVWREEIRPVTLELEKALGEEVYFYSVSGGASDFDVAPVFLALHWCCTYKPELPFVRHLVKISKARDVEELKAALIAPESYMRPTAANDTFQWLGIHGRCVFDYLPPDKRKTIGVVFMTVEAQKAAQTLLAQKIGTHVRLIAPKALLTDEWIRQATRYCRSHQVQYLKDDQVDPIETLAQLDELYTIANKKSGAVPHMEVSESVEDLLREALRLKIEANYVNISPVIRMTAKLFLNSANVRK